MVRYFWTSYSLLESMIAVGFSWPSITPCCREVKTSPKFMVTAFAPRSLNVSRYSLVPATRNLIPFMSMTPDCSIASSAFWLPLASWLCGKTFTSIRPFVFFSTSSANLCAPLSHGESFAVMWDNRIVFGAANAAPARNSAATVMAVSRSTFFPRIAPPFACGFGISVPPLQQRILVHLLQPDPSPVDLGLEPVELRLAVGLEHVLGLPHVLQPLGDGDLFPLLLRVVVDRRDAVLH